MVVGAADVTFGSTGGATRVARSASGAAEERRPLHVDDRTSARVALRVEPGAAATGVTKPVDMVATLRWRGGTARGEGKGGVWWEWDEKAGRSEGRQPSSRATDVR